MSHIKVVSQLEPGDEFGPLAADPQGTTLIVREAAHARLRGNGGGIRNLWLVTDEHGRVWMTGGRRWANDCYGWTRVYPAGQDSVG